MAGLQQFHVHQLFLLSLICNFVTLVSAGYMALMKAESEGSRDEVYSHTVCLAYDPKFSEIPSSPNEANPLPLVDLSDKLGCSPSDFAHPPRNLTGSAVAVSRGNCTFTMKADLAQSVNVSSILIVDYKNSSSFPSPPAGNGSKDYDEINITVASVAWKDYNDVLALPAPVEVKIYAVKSSHFDPNMFVIVFGTILIIITAALCSVYSERKKLTSTLYQSQSSDRSQSDSSLVEITPALVFFWVVCLIGILLLLYFLYDYTVYVFIGIFCIAGSYGLYGCVWPFWSWLFPFRTEIPQRFLLYIKVKAKVQITSLVLFMLCFAVGIFWVVQRHESYAWIFQDILGVAFCISILKTLRLPSLKIVTLVMVLLFCYDVFFVFITPFFTKNGESIMVDVATGGKGHHSEMVPLVFIIPLLYNHPSAVCIGRSFSILGFGDVILPGLLIVYNAVFDIHVKSKMVYFICSSIGYVVGMVGCLIALVFMESGQPALFYLVPATLIPTYAIAFKRHELRAIWTGKFDAKRMDSIINDNSNPNALENADDDDDDDDGLENDEFHDEEQSPLMNDL